MPKEIDWNPIEADYRIGKLAVKAIALKHGVSYSGLRHKAAEAGWTQDLTTVVQAATRAKLTEQARERATKAAAPKPEPKPAAKPAKSAKRGAQVAAKLTDDQLVEHSASEDVAVITGAIDAAVAENVKVINRHRGMADSLMRLVGSLADEVKALTDEDDNPARKAATLGDRVDAVRKLSQTVATVVDVERKAHNLDQQVGNEDNLAEFIKTLQGSSLPIVQDDPEAADR